MKSEYFVTLLAVALLACDPLPQPRPMPPDADAAPTPHDGPNACTFPAGLCGDACKNAARLDCPNDSTQGTCCGEWLCDEPSWLLQRETAQLKCMANASTKDALRACGVICP